MSVYSKFIGTLESLFHIGLNGPLFKNNSGSIDARNNADNAYVNIRVATPSASNDAATKAYVDSGAEPNAEITIRYSIANTPGTQDSTATIPSGAYVTSVEFEVTTPFSNGTTVKIGQSGTLNLLMDTTDNDPTTAGRYKVDLNQAWGGSTLSVRTTVLGSPAAGAGDVFVKYTTPAT